MAEKRDDTPKTPESAPEVRVLTPEQAAQERARAAAQEVAVAPTKRLDETVPGGRYKREDGTLVDANGKEIKD